MNEKGKKYLPRFHMELEGGERGMHILFSGVRRIEDCAADRIILRISNGRLYLYGKELLISLFENRSVAVSGMLSEVSFRYDRA